MDEESNAQANARSAAAVLAMELETVCTRADGPTVQQSAAPPPGHQRPPQPHARQLSVGLLTGADRGSFRRMTDAPMLQARWRNGECQILADRQSWLGNAFHMRDKTDVAERQLVCDRQTEWRRAPDASAARQIAEKEGLRKPVPQDWLRDSTWQGHQRACSQLTSFLVRGGRARLMCWCRHGDVGKWQPRNRCHCDALAADVMAEADAAASTASPALATATSTSSRSAVKRKRKRKQGGSTSRAWDAEDTRDSD